MQDPYKTLAFDYDEFGSIENYLGDEKQFFEKLFASHGTRSVLDCACGTGHHLYMMSELGCSVWGSDYSQSMLDVAKENFKKLGKDIPLCQCDFRYLESKYDRKFDAVVCLTNALPHLYTDEDLLTAVTSMKNRLNSGGLLVFTSGTTHHTLSLPSVEVAVEREDFTRLMIKERSQHFQTIHILDLFHSPQRLEHKQHDIVNRILLDNDYNRLLTQAGFQNIQIYGDYSMHPYSSEDSWRLIVVAKNDASGLDK